MTNIISGIAKTVGGIVGIGGSPTPAPAPTVITPPPPSTTTTDQAANVQSQEDLLRQRQGRAANLLTGSSGVNSTPTGTKTLLGQ
ncbi:hypothetical protein [Burkholderia gladioli]|uniref:hypothetical protein n=1 Tax=Burkholderia gladioli TaxID=28095 RepID=UPI001640EFE1|nr:hypothetical protein [Burkholderia gladioli]